MSTVPVNLDTEHLSTGSKLPPLQEGKVRIYSMRFCPFVQRAHIVAIAKGISFDVVNCNLRQKPEWLLEKNPVGKVPTIEITGKKEPLCESLVICDYLDEAYPGRSLNSTDPFQKALDRVWIENFSSIASLYHKCLYTPPADLDKQLVILQDLFQPFEAELGRRGKFFGATGPGMLDYMIWPWMERLPILSLANPTHFVFAKFLERYPNLKNWISAMKEDHAVKATFLGEDILYQYAKTYKDVTPNYNLLNELKAK